MLASQGFTFTVTIQSNSPSGTVPTGYLEWAVCVQNTHHVLGSARWDVPHAEADGEGHRAPRADRYVLDSRRNAVRPLHFECELLGQLQLRDSSSPTKLILVHKAPTSMHIGLGHNPLLEGSSMQIKAAVVADPATSDSLGAPQGTVTFTVTGAGGDTVTCNSGSNVITISTTSSNQGRAVCTVRAADISAGDSPYEVQAQYSGDHNYDSVASNELVYVDTP